ncbi:ParB/RepB/Spo0J family partition protein [Plectonema cf. radiosum LEGE 06105]|uniref:ParB/RepB/Spo0J family partition protein n=1 Tax=Plectonema cf. radiosum LEGE 06105 TaxID=945769 RepID=A0A8J7K3P9_9CYAN|nr:ParB/RepB/Spo0J family partition protein [Plectonema radiosum]MBE9215956.1 ParB/RepB/Spo0J family partition protein [Plectonema cf. radiosum LEGE 06105]
MTKKRNEPYAAIKKPVDLLFGSAAPSTPENQLLPNTILLAQIKLPSYQPRRYFDPQKLEELSASIKELGILEPLLVRPLPDNNYELVAGERRYRAAQMAGLTEVPVIVRDMDDTITHQVRLVENLQREDLNPLEETEGILELLAMRLNISSHEAIKLLQKMENEAKGKVTPNVRGNSQGLMIEELFVSLGRMKWDSFVKNRLPLLKLPQDVLEALRSGKIEYTKARAIAKVKDEHHRHDLLEDAIAKNLSLVQINERIKATGNVAATVHPLKERYKTALPLLQKSKVWDNPKKQKALEKLLTQIEGLIEE